MKNLAWLSVVVAGAMTLPAELSRAGDEGWAALGGFIGGLVVSGASHHHTTRVVEKTVVVEKPVYVEPEERIIEQVDPSCSEGQVIEKTVVIEEPIYTSSYVVRTRRVWVPGGWTYLTRACGPPVRVWRGGCYKSVPVRVYTPGVSRVVVARPARCW